mmetsp:Transcript_9999/g.35536  ORF Transcript_9999/g.35536 Transcript_9999/m.35536 type:complete len:296 (+) Transcript_9999:298-1185(+)
MPKLLVYFRPVPQNAILSLTLHLDDISLSLTDKPLLLSHGLSLQLERLSLSSCNVHRLLQLNVLHLKHDFLLPQSLCGHRLHNGLLLLCVLDVLGGSCFCIGPIHLHPVLSLPEVKQAVSLGLGLLLLLPPDIRALGVLGCYYVGIGVGFGNGLPGLGLVPGSSLCGFPCHNSSLRLSQSRHVAIAVTDFSDRVAGQLKPEAFKVIHNVLVDPLTKRGPVLIQLLYSECSHDLPLVTLKGFLQGVLNFALSSGEEVGGCKFDGVYVELAVHGRLHLDLGERLQIDLHALHRFCFG